MPNLLSQSLKLLKDAAADYGKDYFSNSIALVNDANELRTEVMGSSKTTIETLRSLKRSINFRNIRDWFYQKEQESDVDDEFDPGFDAGFDDNEDDEPSSHVLDKDEMDKISKRQTNAMYSIAAKHNESRLASTAEIITTLNQRSSELLASVNNINSTLIGISKKLDAFANVYTLKTESEEKRGLYDSNGKLSLGGIYNYSKEQVGGVVGLANMLSFGSDEYRKNAKITDFLGKPEDYVRSILEKTLGSKKLDILGGESINSTLKSLNNKVGEAVQSGLENMISSGPFKVLFGDLRRGPKNQNWGSEVANTYNEKPVAFDGFVKTTIIKTIPEYLRIIARGVTGINYNVDKSGSLSMGTSTLNSSQQRLWDEDQTANRKQYKDENWGKLNNENFRDWNSDLSRTAMQDLYESKTDDISNTDVQMIQRVLQAVYVQNLNTSGKNSLTVKELKDLDTNVISMTAEIIGSSSPKHGVNWSMAVTKVLQRLAVGSGGREFVNAVNKKYKEDRDRRKKYTSTGSPLTSLAGVVTDSDVKEAGITEIKALYEKEALADEIKELREKIYQLKHQHGGDDSSIFDRARNLRDSLTSDNAAEISQLQEKLEQLTEQYRGHGSGFNQTSYGNYLGIAQHGCGPVALAEALARRGLYSPTNGMNVSDFIKASNMYGQPLVAGKVSNMSLRTATPGNPITVLGSGDDFGTMPGSNHFMNVIGTDGNGNVIISNPIDGRIHKRPIGSVGSSSVVGLYGSGRISGAINSFMHRTGDQLFGMAKDKIREAGSTVIDRTDNFIDNSLQKSLDKARAYGNREEISEEDKAQMNLVLSLMESALEDGDGTADRQAIMMEISRIKDQKLKARLRTSVSGMLERSAKKASGTGLLGRLLSGGKGMLKNFFAPLITGISVLVGTVVGKAKKFLSPIVTFMVNRFKKRAIGTVEGIKSFGSGASDVYKSITAIGREIILPKLKEIGKPIIDIAKKVGTAVINKVKSIGKFITGKIKGAFKFVGEKLKNFGKGVFNKLKDFAGKISDWWNNGDFFKRQIDKFRNTSFGKGFMSSFDKTRERMRSKEEAQNPGLAEQRAMEEMLKGQQTSVLTEMRDQLHELIEVEKNGGEETSSESSKKEEKTEPIEMKPGVADGTDWSAPGQSQFVMNPVADGGYGDWNAPARTEQTTVAEDTQQQAEQKQEEQTTRIVDAVDSLKEETVKGNEAEAARDTSAQTADVKHSNELQATVVDVGSMQNSSAAATSAEDEHRTATMTNAAADGKQESYGSKLLGGLGKMFGGAIGAIMNISGMIMQIIASMSGAKALMQLIKQTLTAILKPLNNVFKELVKTVKPVLKILTGTLQDLVASVTGPIADTLTALGPLLEIVAGAVNTILKVLSPIIAGIAKAVGGIVSMIAKPLTKFMGFIQKIINKFAEALAFIIHPLSRKKRAKYMQRMGIPDNDPEEERNESNSSNTTAGTGSNTNSNKQNTTTTLPYGASSIDEDGTPRYSAYDIHGSEKMNAYLDAKLDGSFYEQGKVKSTIPVELTHAEKEREAKRLAQMIYPNDPDKSRNIIEHIMTGDMSLEDAETLSRTAVATEAQNTTVDGEAVNNDTDRLIEFLGDRYKQEDDARKLAEEKADKNREEDIEMQKSMFKHGTLEMVSNTNKIADEAEIQTGLATAQYGAAKSSSGGIVGGLGKIIHAIGEAFALLPWVDENNKIAELGKKMMGDTDQLLADGQSTEEKGLSAIKNTKLALVSAATVGASLKAATNETVPTSTKTTKVVDTTVIANGPYHYSEGDIPYSNINDEATAEIIGSGDAQTSYGNYLNMARRGCGPVALAEAYNRRTGSNINARKLAGSMTSNGAYDPSRGTSVSGYLAASNALGMNTTVGGVTMRSLKKASPNNPITLVGSGSAYGTRTGNIHYMNAIGTDKYGGVYVSNPLTGKIQRRNANDIAGSSLMGIYGNGDMITMDSLSTATQSAMETLKGMTNLFSNIFNTDASSDIDAMANEKKQEYSEASVAKTAMEELSKDDYQTKVMTAMDLYRTDNPIRDGETLEEYEKRISDEWNGKSTVRNKYISMVVSDKISEDLQNRYDTMVANSKGYYEPYVVYQKDAAGNIVHDEAGNPIVSGGFKYLVESDDSDYVKSKKASIAIKKLGEALQASAATAGGGGGSSGGGGGGNMTGQTSDLYEAAAQVWEGAAKKLGAIYSNANHGPITTRSGVELPELHPDCSGMISAAMNYMGYSFKGTMNGSTRRWTTHDLTGKTKNDLIYNSDGSLSNDWEFIPYSAEKLKPGDILTTPIHVGLYIKGDQPNAYGYDAGDQDAGGQRLRQLGAGAAKAYLDRDENWKNYLLWTMGPGYAGEGGGGIPTTILRYVGGKSGSALEEGANAGDASGSTGEFAGGKQGKIQLSAAMKAAPVFWSPYPAKLTSGGYWNQAKKAGLTAAQTAMIAAIGIHEDAAQKLTGEKSLTAVTFDKNGQAAFGLMNWIPDSKNAYRGGHETKYGSTLADQLPYIKKQYFDADSTFSRAKNVNFNDYKAGITQALGHTPKLGANDRWGPYAETDIAESMGHYVANALVPENWYTSAQLAKHMRTAVDAYNWMLDNGQSSGYAAGGGSTTVAGGGVTASGFDLSSILGEYADYLPDYYKNMYSTVQTNINNSADALSSSYSTSSYSDFGDYDYDEELEQGDAEASNTDTRVWATNTEVQTLYKTMKKNHNGGTTWSNSQLLTKGYGDVYLYLDHSDGSKLSCKLQNNKSYAKVTTWGSWVFVYAGGRASDGRPYCGWGHSSDFTDSATAINKKNDHKYKTTTVNPVNSASDAKINNWVGTDTSTKFYKPAYGQKWLDTNTVMSNDDLKHYYTHGSVYTDGRYKRNGHNLKWTTLGMSYDKTIKNKNRPVEVLASGTEKTLAQLNSMIGACGDFDYNTTDSGFFVPGGIYGSGDVTTVANDIPPLSDNVIDQMLNYGSEGSYTVNNYTIQGSGINNDTSDLSRTDLLNYLLKSEFTTRSPRTEKILNKILAKLDAIKTTGTTETTADESDMYDEEVPDVIKSLIRG